MEVTIQKVTGAANTRVITEPGGYFFARGLYSGNYVLTVRPPARMGLSDGSAELAIPGGQGANYTVTIYLKRKSKVADPLLGGGRLIAAQENDSAVPKDARKAYRAGTDAARKHQPDAAVANYKRALEIAPDYLFALNDLGVQYTRLGRFGDSVEVLRHAVKLAPTSYPPHLNLAIALLGAGNMDEASTELRTALGIDSAAPDGLYLSGVLAKRMGRRDEAIDAFRKAYDQGGADVIYAQFELGQLYDSAGQATAAAQAYRLFLQFVQQGPQADHARQRLRALANG
jgi:tetratricopeptide (TPR) repeat protein